MKRILIACLIFSALPIVAQQPERVVTPGFIALNAASLGVAALDVTMTRHCIDAGTCHETNPLMQGSAGRMYGVAVGTAFASGVIDYEMERHGHKIGRLMPWLVISGHTVGIGTALRF